MNPNWSKEENIQFLMQATGMSRREAEFIIAIERGESYGDVVELRNDRTVKPDWAKKDDGE